MKTRLMTHASLFSGELWTRLLDYVQRGEERCKEAAENPLNEEPVSSYYRGKAKAFSEVMEFLKLIDK